MDEEIPLEADNKEVKSPKENFKTLFDQISFIVKHEGDPEEDLADCVYQIPDLVAACRWANYLLLLSGLVLVLVVWFCLLMSCLVWFPCKILFRRADFRKDDGEPMGCRLQLKLGPKGVLNLHIALEEEV